MTRLTWGPIGFALRLFVAQDRQIGEIAKQLIWMEQISVATGKTLDDEQPTGLERRENALRTARPRVVLSGVHIKENDEVPPILAEIVVVQSVDDGVDFDAEFRGAVARLANGDVGEIDSGNLPALLREINGVAACAHAEVKCSSGLATAHRVNQQSTRPMIEFRFRRSEFSVPEVAIVGVDGLRPPERA